jgi:hypothetical protein
MTEMDDASWRLINDRKVTVADRRVQEIACKFEGEDPDGHSG